MQSKPTSPGRIIPLSCEQHLGCQAYPIPRFIHHYIDIACNLICKYTIITLVMFSLFSVHFRAKILWILQFFFYEYNYITHSVLSIESSKRYSVHDCVCIKSTISHAIIPQKMWGMCWSIAINYRSPRLK